MLYGAYQAQIDALAPAKACAKFLVGAIDLLPAPLRDDPVVRWFSASNEMVARAGLTHSRPSFGINEIRVGEEIMRVREEAVETTPFGTLLHFAKQTDVVQPKVLVVAALAGHFSTLLGSTVRTLSQHHDVYVTDWHNAARRASDRRGLRFR